MFVPVACRCLPQQRSASKRIYASNDGRGVHVSPLSIISTLLYSINSGEMYGCQIDVFMNILQGTEVRELISAKEDGRGSIP